MVTAAIPLFAFASIAMVGLGLAQSGDDDAPITSDQKQICDGTQGTYALVANGKCHQLR